MLLLLFAPLLTAAALVTGGIASVVAFLLNGPRRLRRSGEPPMVVLPPIPTREELQQLEAEERARTAI